LHVPAVYTLGKDITVRVGWISAAILMHYISVDWNPDLRLGHPSWSLNSGNDDTAFKPFCTWIHRSCVASGIDHRKTNHIAHHQ
jgi:hypothetical protein